MELPWRRNHTDRGLVVRSRCAACASAVLVLLVLAAAKADTVSVLLGTAGGFAAKTDFATGH